MFVENPKGVDGNVVLDHEALEFAGFENPGITEPFATKAATPRYSEWE